jgi:hypothetical protein
MLCYCYSISDPIAITTVFYCYSARVKAAVFVIDILFLFSRAEIENL